jgi:alpha-galactosidase
MGWNSWNAFHCDVSEQLVEQMADVIVSSGMKQTGYEYVNMDDCWQTSRDPDGTIVADPTRFPSGIPALADYVHAKGLKLGLYTCAGTETCQGRPGSEGYEELDAQTYATWGIDYVKEDWCNTTGLDPHTQYSIMHDAITKTDRSMVLSLCEWGVDDPATWAPADGQLWRTTSDILPAISSALLNADGTEAWAAFAGKGHWNDPDMLEVGNSGLTNDEMQTHMALWAILSAPLISGDDLRSQSAFVASVLTNPEVIAVDQDPDGLQAILLQTTQEGAQVWTKPVAHDGYRAVLLLNQPEGVTATVHLTWSELGLQSGNATVRDLWRRKDLGVFSSGYTATLLNDTSTFLLIEGEELAPPSGTSSLGDLPLKFASNTGGALQQNAGFASAAGGTPMTIAGQSYAKGLGANAASIVLVHLGGSCDSFTADVGIDDNTQGLGAATFELSADGSVLATSPVMTGGMAAQTLTVSLAGRDELKLFVGLSGLDWKSAHADWGHAQLHCH